MRYDKLKEIDPEIEEIIKKELERQQNNLELIASENIVDSCILELQGSILTNKYAEGYPGRRYYGGCKYVDQAENLAIERCKELFKAEYANVQPHSGSQANMAALFALLNPKDKILSMNLAHGGHLTHGSPVSFSGKFFDFCHYGVNPDTGTIDYKEIEEAALRHKPKMIIAGASAYPRIIDFEAFAKIAAGIDAYLMVDMAHISGLVSAGLHPSPVEYAHIVTSTTHKTLRGPRGGLILAKSEFGKKLDKEVFPGIQGGPLMHVIAAKATAFKNAMTPSFKEYQRDIIENAKALAKNLIEAGFNLVSGGTDNHLILLDLSNMGITGKDAENVLEKAGITANKNPVPFDTRPRTITSGIRLGTPAITSRGMKKPEIDLIAQMITDVLKNPDDNILIKKIKDKVVTLCEAFPIYK